MTSEIGLRQALALTLAILVTLSVSGLTLAGRVDAEPTPAQAPPGADRAFCVSSASGDFDGDGDLDDAFVFSAGVSVCTRAGDGSFTLRVRLSEERVVDRTLGGCSRTCRLVGAPDFDLDGRQELLVRLSSSGPVDRLGVFSLFRGSLVRAEAGNRLAVFPIGGGLPSRSWLSCRFEDGRRLVQRLRAEFDGPRLEWLIRRTDLRFAGRDFVTLGFEEYRLAADDPLAFELGGSGNEYVCPPARESG